jgi:hypothetical protein
MKCAGHALKQTIAFDKRLWHSSIPGDRETRRSDLKTIKPSGKEMVTVLVLALHSITTLNWILLHHSSCQTAEDGVNLEKWVR